MIDLTSDVNVKDLRRIVNRDPRSMIIVDNLIQSYSLNMEYGIPIRPYFSDANDYEL